MTFPGMKNLRWIAAGLSVAACSAWAQSYIWTDITPVIGGSSDRGHSQVTTIGIHPLEGNRLIATGGFWPLGQVEPLSYRMLYSDDGGRTWSPPPAQVPNGSLFVNVAQPGTVYAVQQSTLAGYGYFFGYSPASNGALYRSTDFGRTWSQVYTIAIGENIAPLAPDPLDSRSLYAGYHQIYHDFGSPGFPVFARNFGITRTHDDGSTWSAPLASPSADYSFAGPTPSAPARLFMGSYDDGGTFVSQDGGATWSRADSGAPSPLRWIRPDPLRANVLYGYAHTTGEERLLRSDDSGATWKQIFFSSSTPPNLVIDPARPNVLWMPYRTDAIYRSADRGDTWHEVAYPFQDLPPNYDPGAALVTSPSEPGVVYLLRFGRLYRGVAFSPPDPILVEYQYAPDRYWISPRDGEQVFAGYRQDVFHSTGGRFGAWRAGDAPRGALGSCRFQSSPKAGFAARLIVLKDGECEAVKASPDWVLEAEDEFFAVQPAGRASCPQGLLAVHRFFNLKPDYAFRWTADPAVAQQMRDRGWYDEGVLMCARSLGANE